jgi:hypothetical protein
MPRFVVHIFISCGFVRKTTRILIQKPPPVKAQLCNPIFSHTKTFNPMLILSVLLLIAFIFGQQMLKEA